MLQDYLLVCLAFVISFFIVYISTKIWVNLAHKERIVAPDAHKRGTPNVANLGGIPFAIHLVIYLIAGLLVSNLTYSLVIILSTLIGFTVGFLDDLKDLGLKKVALAFFASIPILVLRAYVPRPLFPLIGGTRLYIVYPLIVIATYLVVMNACNMVDTHNGILAIQALFVLSSMLVFAILLNELQNVLFLTIALGAILGFLMLNKYPAKVFWGNCGSYSVGALLATLIILSRKEYIALVALLPTILQGFVVIMSVGGFMTRLLIRERKGRDSYVVNGIIYPSLRYDAPISIPRLIYLSSGPIDEKTLVKKYTLLFMLSFVLSLITGYFVYFVRL